MEATLPADDLRVAQGNRRPIRPQGRAVIYWMEQSQRAEANPALNKALELARQLGKPLLVYFGLTSRYPGATLRAYQFMLEGLQETAATLHALRVPFLLRIEEPPEGIVRLAREVDACAVVGDENPLRHGRAWRETVGRALSIAFLRVDADVVVPAAAFPQEEWAARTLRPKLHRLLSHYLLPLLPPVPSVPWNGPLPPGEVLDVASLLSRLSIDRSVGPSPSFTGGRSHGLRRLERFLAEGLYGYHLRRNDPNAEATSRLSPYLHFGQLGVIEVALAVRASDAPEPAIAAFLEELIVRRELAINFVRHNPNYDSLEGAPDWARRTLEAHRSDPRPVRYPLSVLEAGATHDLLWNAAQRQMVQTGHMHGYLRMLWAKKLLEWTEDPAEAFAIAVYLNDRYELDGRDANGYAGIAWALGGRHDRPWGPERPILGLIRPISSQAARRKFDTAAYIRRWLEPEEAPDA